MALGQIINHGRYIPLFFFFGGAEVVGALYMSRILIIYQIISNHFLPFHRLPVLSACWLFPLVHNDFNLLWRVRLNFFYLCCKQECNIIVFFAVWKLAISSYKVEEYTLLNSIKNLPRKHFNRMSESKCLFHYKYIRLKYTWNFKCVQIPRFKKFQKPQIRHLGSRRLRIFLLT